MSQSQGIIYIAAGLRHTLEAVTSAQSVRQVMPSTPISIFTDVESSRLPEGLFDKILRLKDTKNTFSVKIRPLTESPYEKTLFLDTDTIMVRSCADLFDLLDKFELLVAHDPWRSEYKFETIPNCFPTCNTGVIAFRRSNNVECFVKHWDQLHQDLYGQKHQNDQPSFRHALYESTLRFFILPSEFNLRTYYPCYIGGHAGPRIIHDRNPYLSKVIAKLEETAKAGRPFIYGHIPPRLLSFYYWMKFKKVFRRVVLRQK